MQLSKASLSMLLRRYRSVLKKCHFFNTIGGILLAASLALGLPSIVGATDYNNTTTTTLTTDTTVDGTFSNSDKLTTQADLDLQKATSITTTAGSELNIQGTASGSQRKVYISNLTQLTNLRTGKIIIGPGDGSIGRGQLEITSMDKLTLANSDFSKTATAGKITIEHKGGLNHHGAVELTGTVFDFGGHAANPAGDAGYEPRIKAGSFYLNPTGNQFTLSAGRLYARGHAWENSVVQVGDGTGTLILDGGSLRLGDANTEVVGGTVKASIEVKNTGEFRVSSGNWNMTGTLDVQNGGEFVLGKDADDDGNTLSASLNIESAKLAANSKLNVIDGNVTKFNKFTGDSTATVNVGDNSGSGTFIADNLKMNGGQINFDPPFIAVGDNTNASMGALSFTSDSVDGLLNVGQNSMVSLGSTDAEWLRTEVARYQNDGKGLWGQDITAALAIRTPQTLAAVGGINVDGTWKHGDAAATANTAKFANKSLLAVDAAGVGSKVALSGTGSASKLTVDAGAKLHIVGGQGGQTVNITSGFGASTKDANSWTDANLTTSTALLSATGGTFDPATGTYSVNLTSNAAAASFPKLSGEVAALVDRMALKSGVDVDSSQAGVRFLSRALSDNYIGTTDSDLAASTVESAARMAVIGGVPQMTWAANNAAGNAVTQRTTLAQATGSGVQTMSADGSVQAGASAGDIAKTGFAMWVMPLYQSWNGFGLEGGNFDMDVNGSLGGVAIGADYTFAEAIRAGITFNIGGGYAEGSGDFNKTTNNMNFWGIGAYLGWTPNNFGLTADVNYTSTYNKVEQELPSGMQMGDLKSDVRAYAISAGLRGEYKLETSILDIIPHVGVRYTSLNTDEYDVKSGGTVLKGDAINQNIWTFPVGVAFSKEIETGNGWHFKPSLDLAVIPAAGDIKARGDVRFTGVNGSAEVETQTMDYITYMGQAGLEFGNDTVSLGVNYNVQVGAQSTAHGVFGTFRYEF